MNKKEMYYNRLYNKSTELSIYDAYKKPSARKDSIFNQCKYAQYLKDGRKGRIISHNCQFFTFAFLYNCPVNGNIKLAVITPTKTVTMDWRDDV